MKRTACQRSRLQIRGSWRLNHCMRASRRRGVSGFPTCGRYALIPNYLSLLRTVWALIRWLCVPGVVMAVSTAVRVRLWRCVSLIRRSCLAVVTRGRPLRGRSLVFPNCTRRPYRRRTVVWWTTRAVATSCWVAPWRSIVTAWLRSSLLKRGITGDISHEWWNHVFCVYPSWP